MHTPQIQSIAMVTAVWKNHAIGRHVTDLTNSYKNALPDGWGVTGVRSSTLRIDVNQVAPSVERTLAV